MKKLLLAGAAMLALTACGTSSSPSTLTLAQVQSQVAAIDAGIDAANNLAQASTTLSASAKQVSAAAAATADAAAAAVAALNANSSPAANLVAFDNVASAALSALSPIFAINPATGAAIELGLGLKDAFVAGIGASATMGSTGTTTTGAAAIVLNAPVPVPMPTHIP